MTKKNKLFIFIILLLVLPPFFISASREIFAASYFSSSIYKLIFLTPIFYRLFVNKKNLKQSFSEGFIFSEFKRHIPRALGFGIALASIYGIVFFLFKGFIDIKGISSALGDQASINTGNILAIGAYIIVINSLLEEFFWRGFVFEKLRYVTKPWIAHAISGAAFSFHHIMFYFDWFTIPIFIAVTAGLIVYAMIMNVIFTKTKDLFTCWLVHACADVAQIGVAFYIFGLIS